MDTNILLDSLTRLYEVANYIEEPNRTLIQTIESKLLELIEQL